MAKFNIQRILIAPLDWGLGHATRCIPIIHALQQKNYVVIIACNQVQKLLLSTECTNVVFIDLEGYQIRYSKKKWWFAFKMLFQINKILFAIKNEHNWLNNIVEKYKIDLVISDNRYGLHTQKIPCIFITHQLLVKAPFSWAEVLIQKKLYQYINRFSCVWVPDVAGENNIAGKLSHPTTLPNIPVHYIGLLSRFQNQEQVQIIYKYCFLISGPEPQRSILEKTIFYQLENIQEPIVFIRGLPNCNDVLSSKNHNIVVYNHIQGNALNNIIQSSEFVFSRSGYTTVMELLCMQKKAVFIPTPAQTEQEYLAEVLEERSYAPYVTQNSFQFQTAVDLANSFNYQFSNLTSNENDLANALHTHIQNL
ncbi:MAG: glycosyltransferase [Chitinophagaceae bacterium]